MCWQILIKKQKGLLKGLLLKKGEKMREIKFRLRSVVNEIVGYEKWYPGALDSKNFWEAHPCWLYSKDNKYWNPKPITHRHKDQFTGLKDKNGLTEVYEGDIIGENGLVKGNQYENENLLKDQSNLLIQGFGTKDWEATNREAMARGCQYT